LLHRRPFGYRTAETRDRIPVLLPCLTASATTGDTEGSLLRRFPRLEGRIVFSQALTMTTI
jgi:hypothetical protein